MTAFAELAVTTNFSFLQGASHPEELAFAAAGLGLAGIAVADRNTLAGVVRGHIAAKEAGLPYAVGCRLGFRDDTPDILVWPTDRAAYGRLCRLLTLGNRRAPKGECHLDLADLLEWGEGLMLGVVPDGGRDALAATLGALRDAFPRNVRLMLRRDHGPGDHRRMAGLAALARRFGVPLAATNDVRYHVPERRRLQDVVTCIREHRTLTHAGRLLAPNAERHLKPAAEMARLFRDYPEAVAETAAIFRHLDFSLEELRYQYPDESDRRCGDAAGGAGAAHRGRRPKPFSAWRAEDDPRDPRSRAGADRQAQLRRLFPHRPRHHPLRPREGHPLPGPRLGRQFRRLLLPRHHRGEPGDMRPALRALHLRGARRAARYRRRFRARAARRGDAIHLREIRPRARRARRDRHHLPLALRRARGRQGVRPVGGCGRRALGHGVGLVVGRRARTGRAAHRHGPAGEDHGRGHGLSPRRSAASRATCRSMSAASS